MKCFGFFWEGEGRGKTIYSVAEIDIHFMTQMILKKTIQFFHNKLPQIKKLMQLWAFKGFGWMNFSNYWYMNMIKSQIDSTSNYICCHIGYQIDQMIYHTIAIASLFHTSLSNKQ